MTVRAYRYELIVRKKMHKSLKEQHKFLKEHGEELYNNVFLWYFSRHKTLDGIKQFRSLEEFRESMGVYGWIDTVGKYIKKSLGLGYKRSYRENRNVLQDYGIDFNLENPLVNQYMQNFRNIQLSERKGSIPQTTKDNVVRVLREGVEESLAYGEVAKKIEALDAMTFSRSRADIIAVRETGVAYEYGNYLPMKEAQQQGATVTKKWLTVGDDRVTEGCRNNASVGRIDLDTPFPSGDDFAPRDGNPRCRCTDEYDID